MTDAAIAKHLRTQRHIICASCSRPVAIATWAKRHGGGYRLGVRCHGRSTSVCISLSQIEDAARVNVFADELDRAGLDRHGRHAGMPSSANPFAELTLDAPDRPARRTRGEAQQPRKEPIQ